MSHFPGLLKHVMSGNTCHEYYQPQGNDTRNGNYGQCPPSLDLVVPSVHVTGQRQAIGPANPTTGETTFQYVPGQGKM